MGDNNKDNILTNFIDDSNKYIIYADVCGVPKEEIKIQIKGRVFMIFANREFGAGSTDGFHSLVQIKNGSLCRMIELQDNIDISNIIAEYKNGLLKVIIPKIKNATEVDIVIK